MSNVVEWYKDIMYNKHDPRTEGWFLASGPGGLIMIIVTYIYFSLSAGPRYMRDKKPLELKNVLIVYNFIQVLCSLYMFYEGLMAGWLKHYNLSCQPVEPVDNPRAMRMARAVHFYFICKLIELMDTVFFVLRKKNQQISFLHVYHHALMPLCAWIGVRYYPGGHATFLGVINTFIHVIMYTYYMLSSMGPHMQKYLWWKKHLTTIQIVQFVMVFFHTAQLFVNGCTVVAKPLVFLLTLNTIIFIYLFSSFYVQTYRRQLKEEFEKNSKTPTVQERRKVE